MKRTRLMVMMGLGTAIVLLETRRRRAHRREVEERLELGRWESEGGAVNSNAPDPDEVLPGQAPSPGHSIQWCTSI